VIFSPKFLCEGQALRDNLAQPQIESQLYGQDAEAQIDGQGHEALCHSWQGQYRYGQLKQRLFHGV